MKTDSFRKLFDFLHRLDESKIHYTLSRNRDDAISIEIVVPGQRWEVDFLEDGGIDVERFVSSGDVQGEATLEVLFASFSARQEDPAHHDVTA